MRISKSDWINQNAAPDFREQAYFALAKVGGDGPCWDMLNVQTADTDMTIKMSCSDGIAGVIPAGSSYIKVCNSMASDYYFWRDGRIYSFYF